MPQAQVCTATPTAPVPCRTGPGGNAVRAWLEGTIYLTAIAMAAAIKHGARRGTTAYATHQPTHEIYLLLSTEEPGNDLGS